MIWKPKEKELTPEEAIAAAKKELAPYWIHSSPLLAGVHIQSQFSLHPLDKEFKNQQWLIFAIDPFQPDALDALGFFHELKTRYESLQLHFLMLIRTEFDFAQKTRWLEDRAQEWKVNGAFATDPQNVLLPALGLNTIPGATLLSDGKSYFTRQGNELYSHFENDLQQYLRTKDKGLPLPLLFHLDHKPAHTLVKYLPGPKAVAPSMLTFKGSWNDEPRGKLATKNDASLEILLEGNSLSIVVEPAKVLAEPLFIEVELEGNIPLEVVKGANLETNDDGKAQLRVLRPASFEVFKKLPSNARKVTMHFKSSDETSLRLLGLTVFNL